MDDRTFQRAKRLDEKITKLTLRISDLKTYYHWKYSSMNGDEYNFHFIQQGGICHLDGDDPISASAIRSSCIPVRHEVFMKILNLVLEDMQDELAQLTAEMEAL